MILTRRVCGWTKVVSINPSPLGEPTPIIFLTMGDAQQFLDQQYLDWGYENDKTMRIESYDIVKLIDRRFPPGDKRNNDLPADEEKLWSKA